MSKTDSLLDSIDLRTLEVETEHLEEFNLDDLKQQMAQIRDYVKQLRYILGSQSSETTPWKT